jgi:hypothetical protein
MGLRGERRGFVLAAIGVLACALALPGCGLEKAAREEALSLITQNLDKMFAEVEGGLSEKDLQACLTERDDDLARKLPQISGKPVFKPNHFFSCAANNTTLLGKYYKPDERHILVFDVSVPVGKAPVGKEAVSARTTGVYTMHCAFVLDSGKVEPYKAKVLLAGLIKSQAVPSSLSRFNICLDLPNAASYVTYR